MSLFMDMMDDCVLLERDLQSDGEGGFISNGWRESVSFKAAVILDQSIQARVAEQAGVTSVWTVTVPATVTLPYHSVFRRTRDGKTFRTTGDTTNKITPDVASFSFCQCTAERWELTT